MNACVIKNNLFVVFVITDADGNPLYYNMEAGEKLVYADPPAVKTEQVRNGILKPRWNGVEWEEAATAEEIRAWEADHPIPETSAPGPSLEDRVTALEEQTKTWNAEAESAYQKGVQKA